MKKPKFITNILRLFHTPNPVDLIRLGFEQHSAARKAIGPRPQFKLSPELAALLTQPGPTMTIVTRMEGIPAHAITAGLKMPIIWFSPECGRPQFSSARGGASCTCWKYLDEFQKWEGQHAQAIASCPVHGKKVDIDNAFHPNETI